MNTINIIQNEHCSIKTYTESPVLNDTLYIYIESIDYGYTLKSLTVSNDLSSTVYTYDGTSKYKVVGISGLIFKFPYVITSNDLGVINISVELYVNPTITEIRYNNNYSIDSYEFTNMQPELWSKCGFVNITMVGGWKFLKYEIYKVGVDDHPYDTKWSFNGKEFTITPASYFAGEQFYIVIYNDPDQIPFTFICYAYNESSHAYRRIDNDIVYKTTEELGTYFNYVPKYIDGYASNLSIINDVAVIEGGNAIPVYYSPIFYKITGLWCDIIIASGNSAVKYTETVTVTFNRSKYTGNPLDIFDHWETDNGYQIPDNANQTVSFSMPNMDIVIYPVMKPYRINSNMYKNIDNELLDGTSIYESFLNNTRYADDIIQNNHGFNVGDIVYLDSNDNKYKKAIADGTTKSLAVGIVRNVNSINSFGIQYGGIFKYDVQWPNKESSIMYLSDTNAGQFKYYADIRNRVYVPIAIYTHNGIIMCMHEGTVGAEYPYYPDSDNEEDGAGPTIERYLEYELNGMISDIISMYT